MVWNNFDWDSNSWGAVVLLSRWVLQPRACILSYHTFALHIVFAKASCQYIPLMAHACVHLFCRLNPKNPFYKERMQGFVKVRSGAWSSSAQSLADLHALQFELTQLCPSAEHCERPTRQNLPELQDWTPATAGPWVKYSPKGLAFTGNWGSLRHTGNGIFLLKVGDTAEKAAPPGLMGDRHPLDLCVHSHAHKYACSAGVRQQGTQHFSVQDGGLHWPSATPLHHGRP